MGCYLLLNVVDRLRWKGEDLQPLFRRVILDSPDVPTWFFSSMTKVFTLMTAIPWTMDGGRTMSRILCGMA